MNKFKKMKNKYQHIDNFLSATSIVSSLINREELNNLINVIVDIRNKKGRLFFLGVGGSAANSSHAVNDFRKICNIECYAPTDNVAELTARINDEGWDDSIAAWLKTSKLNKKDGIFIFSVGGGNLQKKVSVNLVKAIMYGSKCSAKVMGVVGRDGGYTKKIGKKSVVVIPNIENNIVTPLAEAFQAVIWHCIVSHPALQINKNKW